MIIVEGPDLAGKSTLCKALKELATTPMQIHHLSRLQDWFHRYWDYVALMSKSVIADRFHISDPAYAAARGELSCKLDPEYARLVEAKLALLGAVTVLLLPSEADITSRWREGEMYDLQTVLRARSAYEDIAQHKKIFQTYEPYRFNIDLAVVGPFDTDRIAHRILELHDARVYRRDRVMMAKPYSMMEL